MVRAIPDLAIVYVPINEIKPYPDNPREHPPEQIRGLAKSFKRNGLINPLLLTPAKDIIAGGGRYKAAQLTGMSTVPAIILSHLSEAECRAYRIADNKLAERGKWNLGLLRKEVQFLLDDGFAIDPEEFGFETGEFDFLLAETESTDEVPVMVEPRRDRPAVAKLGDIFTCAGHRLICGDALKRETYIALLGTEKAVAVVTDMPWNRASHQIGGKGRVRHPDFKMAAGELTLEQFSEFIRVAFVLQVEFSHDGAICLNYIDWRSLALMISIGESIFKGGLINLCVWSKQTGGMGSMWRSRHELICAFKAGKGKHINNVMLGKWGRNRTNVWDYPAPLGWGSDRDNLELHPTSKNVEMLADAVMDITNRGDLVLDPFSGSGATLLACHNTGRRGCAIELDEYYVDVALERLIASTGEEAFDADGNSFTERRKAGREEA